MPSQEGLEEDLGKSGRAARVPQLLVGEQISLQGLVEAVVRVLGKTVPPRAPREQNGEEELAVSQPLVGPLLATGEHLSSEEQAEPREEVSRLRVQNPRVAAEAGLGSMRMPLQALEGQQGL